MTAIRSGLLLILCACGAAPLLAAEAQPEPEKLDQVVVTGKRLRELRSDVVKAQERFLDLYNSLNPDKRYEMNCEADAATGTRLERRKCSTRGEEDVRSEEAQAVASRLQIMQSVMDVVQALREDGSPDYQMFARGALPAENGILTPTVPNSGASEEKGRLDGERGDFNRNLNALLAKYPELRQRAGEYWAARRRLEAAQDRKAVTP